MKLDDNTLIALSTLNGSKEFNLLCQAFAKELDATDVSLRNCGLDTYQKLQGRASMLAEILHEVALANERVHKLRK